MELIKPYPPNGKKRCPPFASQCVLGSNSMQQGCRSTVQGSLQIDFDQLAYGFNGQIPDAQVFRISSIARDPITAHKLQKQSTEDFVTARPTASRLKLASLDMQSQNDKQAAM